MNIVTIQLQECTEASRLFQRMNFDTLQIFDDLDFQNVTV